ncbi:hypothetical protein NM688_g3250 [Phlebia brevispora]|uniref:Uncharacterized protein n=1 Tax=Phlebia brevispora TaxID=194682 RepID=A0ACC1T6G9_9APHY|nr:hypothetical protein NM688_g3250 [Phlebia brevispora]
MAYSSLHPLVFSFEPTDADIALKAKQNAKYVRDLWILIACVIGFLTVVRALRWLLFSVIFPARPVPSSEFTTQSEKTNGEAVQSGASGRVSWRRLPSAFTSAFRVVAFRLNIPIGPGSVASVTELLFIFGYMAAIFAWLFIDTEDLTTWFYEDRAAHFASCQLPLIVALAGKNNIISFLTGVSHEKLNVLHRAAARTCLILLWIHAICRAVGGLPEKFDFTHGWMRCGAAGLAAFTLATILSFRPIRNAFFEFFLLSHIVLVGIFLVGGYIHARDPGYGNYIWPALVVWGFDRALRAVRLFWNSRSGNNQDASSSLATVELVSHDTVRMTLRRRMHWKPGQHAYVILPTVSDLPTEAHPFTIASIPHSLRGNDDSAEKDVVFLIRGRNGFTGRLREHARDKGSAAVPAYIDGPYGCPPDLTTFSTCILIAGGSGVSYTLPLLLNLVHKARLNQSVVRRAVFVWSLTWILEHLKWISKLLNEAFTAAQSTTLTVDMRVYITGPNAPRLEELESTDSGSVSADSPTSENEEKIPVYSAIKITHGRPSVRKIFDEEITTALGPVSVDVAGPSGLSQSVSQALASRLTSPISVLKGTPTVTLHTETFGMTR